MSRSPLNKAVTLALASALAFSCYGAEFSDQKHLERIAKPSNVDEAVNKGLAYLVGKQDPIQGFFKGEVNMPNTHTALSCMAFMAAGHFPGRSKYGDNLRRGVMYLVRASKKHKGYFGNEGSARMYGQGICTLALCEAYGMMQKEEDNRKIKKAIERALKVIINAQNKTKGAKFGGWRYSPTPGDSDLSVAAWQMLALRAAQNCKLKVPDKVIEDAIEYLHKSYNPTAKGFSYQPGGAPSICMRSAGAVSMMALGANVTDSDKEMCRNTTEYLLSLDPSRGGHFYYQSYYIGTAANMMGKKHREILLPKLEKALLGLQMPNGEFRKHTGNQGGVYSTAFSVICLCIRYQYLPIYQE